MSVGRGREGMVGAERERVREKGREGDRERQREMRGCICVTDQQIIGYISYFW